MDLLEKYLIAHSTPQSEELIWLTRQTHLRTNRGRMLSGPILGKFLEMVTKMISPSRVLEIGTFTGYSTIAISRGLAPGGTIDTIEINDELEDLIREAYDKAGITERVRLIFGDVLQVLPTLKEGYDFIFLDANKREYPRYYEAAIGLLRSGGFILADNVLWDGKVYEDSPSTDPQTRGILEFNRIVAEDPRVENVIIPLRDGINIIRKL